MFRKEKGKAKTKHITLQEFKGTNERSDQADTTDPRDASGWQKRGCAQEEQKITSKELTARLQAVRETARNKIEIGNL